MSIVVSIISLLVSLATLYLTQFRPPSLVTNIGPTIQAYHYSAGGLALIVPVAIGNQAPTGGSVERAAITLYRKDDSQQRFFMAWDRFMTYRYETTSWEPGDIAHALPITGQSSVVRLVRFSWEQYSRPELELQTGEYVLVFHYWVPGEGRPKTTVHGFSVTKDMADALAGYRKTKVPWNIHITLDKQIDHNKLMTEHEFRTLLTR